MFTPEKGKQNWLPRNVSFCAKKKKKKKNYIHNNFTNT